jgi:hypothetical protein
VVPVSFETVLSLALGSVITLVLGYVFYTLQEKRARTVDVERLEMANDEFVNTLMRIAILHVSLLSPENVMLLFLRKSRQYRVDPKKMIPPLQALNDVYARITENEFLSDSRRSSVLKAITKITKKQDAPKYRLSRYTATYMVEETIISSHRGSFAIGFVLSAIVMGFLIYGLSNLFSEMSYLNQIILFFMALIVWSLLWIIAAISLDIALDSLLKGRSPLVEEDLRKEIFAEGKLVRKRTKPTRREEPFTLSRLRISSSGSKRK